MPRGFESVPGSGGDVWTLLQFPRTPPSEGIEWGHNLRVLGRLRAGISVDEARREMAFIGSHPRPEYARPPWSAMKAGLTVGSLQEQVTRAVRPALLSVLGAVGLLLLIACVNVTNLLLAR